MAEEGAALPACVVCWSAPRRVCLTACGHAVLCAPCCARLSAAPRPRCPVCALPIPSGAWQQLAEEQLPSFLPARVDAGDAARAAALGAEADAARTQPPDEADDEQHGGADLGALMAQALAAMAVLGEGGAMLHVAAEDDLCVSAVAGLLAGGAVDVDSRRCDGATPLHVSASRGSVAVAALLLSRGADAGARDAEGATPLHCARHAAVAQALLGAGARASARDSAGCTPLHGAAARGDSALAALLLAHGADAAAADAAGRTPAHAAADARSVDVLLLLLAAGGTACARDAEGLTPLHLAARAGGGACAAALLAAGADVDARSACGATPLHCAWGDAPGALLAARADVAAADVCGWTPLHAAARAGDDALCAALLAAGADRRSRTRDGETAAELAPQGSAAANRLRRRPAGALLRLGAAAAIFVMARQRRGKSC